jgi:hypothetical protein
LVDTLDFLPTQHSGRDTIIGVLRRLATASCDIRTPGRGFGIRSSIKAAGGTVEGEPREFGGTGMIVGFAADPAGNRIETIRNSLSTLEEVFNEREGKNRFLTGRGCGMFTALTR